MPYAAHTQPTLPRKAAGKRGVRYERPKSHVKNMKKKRLNSKSIQHAFVPTLGTTDGSNVETDIERVPNICALNSEGVLSPIQGLALALGASDKPYDFFRPQA